MRLSLRHDARNEMRQRMRCECHQARLELLADLLRWANRYRTSLGERGYRELTARLAMQVDVIKAEMPVKRRVLTAVKREDRK